MKIKISIKFNKLKGSLKRLPRILAEHIFLSFLGLLSLALIFGGFIFYKYSILTEKIEPKILEKPLQFKEALYQKILEEWQIRQKRFEEAELKEYPDPFRGPTPTEELTE